MTWPTGALSYALSTLDLRGGRLAEVRALFELHRDGTMVDLSDAWLAMVHDALWRREEWLLTGALQSDLYERREGK